MMNKPFSTTYSSTGEVPTTTYNTGGGSCEYSFNLHGLTPDEAQYAIRDHALAKDSARRRGIEQRKQHEANLRRQGFDEDYIKTH